MTGSDFNMYNALCEWGATLPGWQKCLLAKLIGSGELAQEDLKQILAEYLYDQELEVAPEPRDAWEILIPDAEQAPHTPHSPLKAIDSVIGVNGLVAGEVLAFGPKVTVVYGPNGAGKSGYARILKSACFSRSKKNKILGDIRAGDDQPSPKANFVFEDGTQLPYEYKKELPRMRSAFSVFDSSCITVHIDERNTFQVMPQLFDVFPRMVDAIGTIQSLLMVEKQKRFRDRTQFAIEGSSSEVATAIAVVTAETDLDELKQLAVFGEAEEARIVAIELKLAELRSLDPKEVVRKNLQRIIDLKSLVVSLKKLPEVITNDGIEELRGILETIEGLSVKATAAAAARFNEEPVQPIGTAAWRDLILAAVAYNAEAYPGEDFPPTVEDPRCVLCQQPLDTTTGDRLLRFFDAVNDDIESELAAERTSLKTNKTTFENLDLGFFAVDGAIRRTLSELDPILESDVVGHVSGYERVVRVIDDCQDSSQLLFSVLLHDSVTDRLQSLINNIVAENDALKDSDPSKSIEDLLKELQRLRDQKDLSDKYDNIVACVADMKWTAKAETCSRSFPTIKADVTKKQKALASELVGKGFLTIFARNCDELGLVLPVQFKFKGDSGTTDRQIEISTQGSEVGPSEVLSEGEQTAAALADFLTEVELNAQCAGVIFDDPVTSLDHTRKEIIAKRLVEEASKRQVVVFTHDIMFTNFLAEAAEKQGVPFKGQTVCTDAAGPGVIDQLAFPHVHYETMAQDKAQEHLEAARTLTGDAQRGSLEKACGSLRTAYEDFIQKKLFNKVVGRWRENIMFTLDQVYFDEAIADRVHQRMVFLSRYIDGHSHSETFHDSPLTPQLVESERDLLVAIKSDYNAARREWERARPQKSFS